MNHQGICCIRTSQNLFLWFKSTRRMPGTEVLVLHTYRNAVEEMTEEKRCLKKRYHIRGKVNIFMLDCSS